MAKPARLAFLSHRTIGKWRVVSVTRHTRAPVRRARQTFDPIRIIEVSILLGYGSGLPATASHPQPPSRRMIDGLFMRVKSGALSPSDSLPMRRLHLLLTSFLVVLTAQADASERRAKPRTQRATCTAVCVDLATLIRRDPNKLVMGVEDALVISESCTREIVFTAIDAVNADPRRVRQIYEAAVKVVPHRKDEVWQAVRQFSVPAALPMKEPTPEVRRAKLPDSNLPAVLEVRRAEAPGAKNNVPIPEVRRAMVPAK